MLGYTLALLQQLLIQENNGSFQTPQEPNPDFLQKPIFTRSPSNSPVSDQPPEDLGFESPDFIMEDPEEKKEGTDKEDNQPGDPDNLNEEQDDNLDFSKIDVGEEMKIKTYQPALSFLQNSDTWSTKVTSYFYSHKTLHPPLSLTHSL